MEYMALHPIIPINQFLIIYYVVDNVFLVKQLNYYVYILINSFELYRFP